MDTYYCPQCQQQLVEYLLERGVALACPACWQIHHFAEYVAQSPTFPYEVRQKAEKVSALALWLGLGALGAVVLSAIFDRPNRRR